MTRHISFLLVLTLSLLACGDGEAQNRIPEIDREWLMGNMNYTRDARFIRIERPYGARDGMYLHKETYEAFKLMYAAAKRDGVSLQIRSALRGFSDQKRIWEGKWNGQRKVDGQRLNQTIPDPKARALKILRFSSMPGTSRHHWGTDIDINSFVNSYFERGRGKQEYDWLRANAVRYGFCQTYTAKGPDRPTGYEEERWHWTYLPVARDLTRAYLNQISYDDINGFDGDQTARELQVIQKYVAGIASACK